MATEDEALLARGFTRYTSREYQKVDGVLSMEWVQGLLAQQDTSSVITAGAMVSKDSKLPADHMFTAFLKVGLINDMLCLYSSESQNFHTIVTLGSNVCGHPKIVHGGLTSAIIDETLGGLNYVLKREGVIGSGPSFTVHLEVDYKRPIPSESTVICTAGLTSIEGRKAWVHATVQDRPGGEVFATGKALFVIPKQDSALQQQNGLEESLGKK